MPKVKKTQKQKALEEGYFSVTDKRNNQAIKNGFESYIDYRKKQLKEQGFDSVAEYQNRNAQLNGFATHAECTKFRAWLRGWMSPDEYKQTLYKLFKKSKHFDRPEQIYVDCFSQVNLIKNQLSVKILVDLKRFNQIESDLGITGVVQHLPKKLSEDILDLEEEHQQKSQISNYANLRLIQKQMSGQIWMEQSNFNQVQSHFEITGVNQHLPNELSEDILDLEEEYQQKSQINNCTNISLFGNQSLEQTQKEINDNSVEQMTQYY